MPNANIVEIYCMLNEFSRLFAAACRRMASSWVAGAPAAARTSRRCSPTDAQGRCTGVSIVDSTPLAREAFTRKLFGRMVGDMRYISQTLSERLLAKGVRLTTRIKRSMKNRVMEVQDQLLLRKCAGMETVIGMLKHVCQIEHMRHRSFPGFVTNLCSGLIAYGFLPKKPKIHLANGSAATHQTVL